jgi:hypothetical protein
MAPISDSITHAITITHFFIGQPLCRIRSAGRRIILVISDLALVVQSPREVVQLDSGALMIEESKYGVNTKTGADSGSVIVPGDLTVRPTGGCLTGVGGRWLATRIGDAAAGTAAGTTVFLPEALIKNPAHIYGGSDDDQDDNNGFHG